MSARFSRQETADAADVRLAVEADAQSRAREGAPGEHPEFEALVRTIWRLRQPDGCPWDKEQTHESIARNMLEEAYEAYDAILQNDTVHLREELGDVLMQVLLHAQIAADGARADSPATGDAHAEAAGLAAAEKSFDIDDVCRELNQKLVRRHPHVFGPGAGAAENSAEVLAVWEDVKASERARAAESDGALHGLLDSVPSSMPALMQAQKVSKRAAKVGFDWERIEDVWAKVDEERAEFLAEAPGSPEAELEFGDLLFALVNVARKQGIDAEAALRAATEKFRTRFGAVEQAAAADGFAVEDLDVAQLDQLWNAAKQK